MVLLLLIILAVLIWLLQAELESERQIEDVMEISCPACQRMIDIDAMVCPYCQLQLREACSTCHRGKLISHKHCPYCGSIQKRGK
ncbi:zinc ribbon domain-containing protein [Malonomonas rubra]|uniref:zinc ribbon domain-containing protein n=1 Tax=Malonomonas rubra TaxID=57040 RepID=UPI0026EEE477|nr:zinc ribbon domain-containing protein [Malonomonas rubra]